MLLPARHDSMCFGRAARIGLAPTCGPAAMSLLDHRNRGTTRRGAAERRFVSSDSVGVGATRSRHGCGGSCRGEGVGPGTAAPTRNVGQRPLTETAPVTIVPASLSPRIIRAEVPEIAFRVAAGEQAAAVVLVGDL